MTEPTTEAKVLEFPKRNLAKKATKVVVAVGMISAGVLTYVNYKAKSLEPLGTDAEEQARVEGTE